MHVTALQNDYYHFEPAHHRLVGERTGKAYRLGDPIDVRVVRVDLDDRKIDFELVGTRSVKDPRPGRKSKAGTRRRGRKKTTGGARRGTAKADRKDAPGTSVKKKRSPRRRARR